jgi:hypothetical protein
MSKRPRRNHTPAFKAKVALALNLYRHGLENRNISGTCQAAYKMLVCIHEDCLGSKADGRYFP